MESHFRPSTTEEPTNHLQQILIWRRTRLNSISLWSPNISTPLHFHFLAKVCPKPQQGTKRMDEMRMRIPNLLILLLVSIFWSDFLHYTRHTTTKKRRRRRLGTSPSLNAIFSTLLSFAHCYLSLVFLIPDEPLTDNLSSLSFAQQPNII